MFLTLADADADIDVRELQVVALAADCLGLPFERVVDYLTGMLAGG